MKREENITWKKTRVRKVAEANTGGRFAALTEEDLTREDSGMEGGNHLSKFLEKR